MALNTNISAQLQRVASDVEPREAINDTSFVLTDTSNAPGGSVTPITVGGELGWQLAADTKIRAIFPSISTNTTSVGGGVTIALRVRFDSLTGSGRPSIFGITSSTTATTAGPFVGVESSSLLRTRESTSGTHNFTRPALGAVTTIVLKMTTDTVTDGDFLKVWVQGGDRATTDPDFIKGSGDNLSSRSGIANLYVNCPTSSGMVVLDAIAYNDEKTDAECVLLADSYRASVPTVSGGGNVAPDADAGPDQTGVTAGSTVTLTSAASSDSDGVISTYTWTQLSGTTVTLSDDTAASPTFTAPSTGAPQDLTFQVEVTDDDAATDTDTVTISVLAASGASLNTTVNNLTRSTRPNLSGITAYVQRISDGVIVATKVGLTTDASGNLTVTDNAIVSGTEYRLILVQGTDDGVGRRTAS